jgi:hypothetical protein
MAHSSHQSHEQGDNEEDLAVKEHVKTMLRKLISRMQRNSAGHDAK